MLGCLLFLIYINDLPKIINAVSILFADDISVVLPCKNELTLNKDVNEILNNITNWLKAHNLKLNFQKTKVMQFHPYQKRPLNIACSYNNVDLECINTSKLLGLNIDSHLNWKSHIEVISGKLSSFTYALNELKKTTDLKSATNAYYAYAHSWLRYGILLWGNSTQADTLFIIKKKCIRILTNTDRMTSCRQHFKKLNILTLTCLYILEVCLFVKKRPELFPLTKDHHTRDRNLRNKNRLAMPTSSLTLFHSGPYVMAIKVYNKIPRILKHMTNFNLFRNNLTRYLNQKCYYNLREFFEDINETKIL